MDWKISDKKEVALPVDRVAASFKKNKHYSYG